ncbi:phosphatase PAP2 family protein [Puia dinghuensis]|uniref:Phosphatidylglycerophosphatase B n=1 Tax=Puia dinghuensis TaxID=1792502 RepID=A0A8J2UEY1_9BACT|nr:phosphatase PAP2 family protein [Puia dinghuensis]GGB07410.1 phosphatidylglycerophosphatase B [Puia dinghuensis]
MKTLREIISGNRLFFSLWGIFFFVGLLFLLTVGKAAAFVDLNPYHRTTLDTIFVWITFLGDATFSIIVFVIFLVRRRWSKATQVILAFLISGLLAQILKNVFSMPRPKQFFAPGSYPYFIDGVTHLGFASFPSGHTTSIFALATLLAIFTKDQRGKVAYLLGAIIVGYSRIYLGQHFLGDVLMGSCIGILVAVLIHWLFVEKLQSLPVFAPKNP